MRKIAIGLSLLCAAMAFAEGPTPDGTWTILNKMPENVVAQEPWIRPDRFTTLVLNHTQMRDSLRAAPNEKSPGAWDGALFFWLPDPDGNIQCFRILESPVMEPELQAEFPQIRTYVGQGISDPTATVRIDFTDPSAPWNGAGGFHAQVLSVNGRWYIDPYSRGNFTFYTSHYKKDLKNIHDFQCHVEDEGIHIDPIDPDDNISIARSGPTLRTYRLSNAATGEYTTFHGGTVPAGQNAIVVAINRVTGVYEVEQAVRLVLIATNSNNVFTTAGTDPYTNNNGATMLGENQTRMNTVPGSAGYDIGHVFSTGGGGVAGLGVVCSAGNKARGVTGLPSPINDAFYIDFVAHEMGHQFGGNHTFNSPSGNCAGNRAASAAYEPGSGSTIMAYAGICSPDDLQSNSDAYMHSKSFDEILAYTNTGGGNACAVQSATGNTAPTVNAGLDYSIPTGTPFIVTATGSDPNGDPLTYCWEERDLGASITLATADNGTSPLIRSLPATTSPSRMIPKLATILALTTDPKEKLPAVARNMNMRVTARDNRAAGGGVNTDDMIIHVINTGAAFAITSQNTAPISYPAGSTQAVTWNVAGTTANGINCANVMIEWSTNNASTWTTLIASTPNDGSENIVIPNTQTSLARVRVSGVGNIFFDINNAFIQVTAGLPSPPSNLAANPNPQCEGNTVTLTGTVGAGETIDWYANTCSGVPVASGATAVRTATVTTTYFAKTRVQATGQQSATCTQVTSTVIPLPVDPDAATVDRNNFCTSDSGNIVLSVTGGSGTTARWFTDSCGGTSIGTGASLTIPSPTATTTYFVRWENQCALTGCASITVNVTQQAADFNNDGSVDFFDYLDFVAAFSGNDPGADFNSDGAIDFFDYLDFVSAFSLGGC